MKTVEELIVGLRALLETEGCDEAIRVVAAAIKAAGASAEIETDDESPDGLNSDDALWVTSTHRLLIDGEQIAEWTRCAMGCYGEAGRQCSEDDWCVSEDTNGGDELPENIGVVLEALSLKDEIPDVPEPEKATEIHDTDTDGEWAVYWETVGDDAHVCQRYSTREAAEAVRNQRNREFSAANPSGGGTSYLCGYGVRMLVDGKWVASECE